MKLCSIPLRLLLVVLIIPVTGCSIGGDDNDDDDGFPRRPAIGGAQIDRMGRAAVTSALVSPLAPADQRGADRDAYNSAGPDSWAGFADIIAGTLGVLDALDANCGNQLLAGDDDATRYDTLASVLADDRLYVNAASGLCNQYFGVELNATGLVPNDDCGGRTPLYDTIDVSYTALSNDLSIPVGDGVPSDDVMHGDAGFPFLAEYTPPPPVPQIGVDQIDRMGRSAIATALISPIADDQQRGADRDAYNAADEPEWTGFSDNLRTHLAVYDALDASCGNQILADSASSTPSRYDSLTAALIDDRLYVNASSGSCIQYFGVELNATGLVPNADCGGRTPLYDTIDVSYTALSNDLSIAVGDGVPMDDRSHSSTDFPFLATP